MELQKDRYLESLSAKYWNNSVKGDCENTDENEGITLQSLGGVFIATLFGLALAMITLVGEVIYYKRKEEKANESRVFPVDSKEKLAEINNNLQNINLGKEEFIPYNNKAPRLSYASLYSRKFDKEVSHY